MQHVTMADKSLLVGDRVAGLLVEYAALIAQVAGGDTVRVNAVGPDGSPVVATFLLNSGTVLMIESTHSELPEPDNGEAEAYLQERLDSYTLSGGDLISLDQNDESNSSS